MSSFNIDYGDPLLDLSYLLNTMMQENKRESVTGHGSVTAIQNLCQHCGAVATGIIFLEELQGWKVQCDVGVTHC